MKGEKQQPYTNRRTQAHTRQDVKDFLGVVEIPYVILTSYLLNFESIYE